MTARIRNANPKVPRFLLGGVPFGCDNVGDEAILECIVGIVRDKWPEADIWVSTADQGNTAARLNVKTLPLFGFSSTVPETFDIRQAIDQVDVVIWAGATGLSDYPDIPLNMFRHAIERKKKTVVFCVGMNSELNPYLYKLQRGVRSTLYHGLAKTSLGMIDLTRQYESKKVERTRENMRLVLAATDLIIVRDTPSEVALVDFLGEVPRVLVGADPAVRLRPKAIDSTGFEHAVRSTCSSSGAKVGLCISAQRPIRQVQDLAELIDRLIDKFAIKVVGIPMNPTTDSHLMMSFRCRLRNKGSMLIAEGRFEPAEIAALAGQMDLIISSRLHLLIFALISRVPFIGIKRGSKILTLLNEMQLPDVGSVDDLNIPALESESERLLSGRAAFEKRAAIVLAGMSRRLARACNALHAQVNRTPEVDTRNHGGYNLRS